jgi:hypothetical protein
LAVVASQEMRSSFLSVQSVEMNLWMRVSRVTVDMFIHAVMRGSL